ncbi:DUF397 domain-containing protein [Umezawaea beigongshangensis]|uniref:DUF397 domain-containing protein n=1 Tax=Umezawaea beigongshangensis TaxID=2780383 RepID=UPI0018F14BD6|nr:DUF397 domain-containing protein [Umezawaea beigongshangensis]
MDRVEPARQHPGAVWRKSSWSSAGGPECVEVALGGSWAAVRDSKNAAAGALGFTSAGWERFLGAAKDGEFDRP